MVMFRLSVRPRACKRCRLSTENRLGTVEWLNLIDDGRHSAQVVTVVQFGENNYPEFWRGHWLSRICRLDDGELVSIALATVTND